MAKAKYECTGGATCGQKTRLDVKAYRSQLDLLDTNMEFEIGCLLSEDLQLQSESISCWCSPEKIDVLKFWKISRLPVWTGKIMAKTEWRLK